MSNIGGEPLMTAYHQLHGEDLQEKFKLIAPESDDRCRCRNLGPSRCCCAKKFLKALFALLVFHLLTIPVAFCGVLAVVLFLGSILLNLCFIPLIALVAFGGVPLWWLSRLPERQKHLKYSGYVVVVALCLALMVISLFNLYTALAPFTLLCAGGFGVGIFYMSIEILLWLVSRDIRLANFVNSATPSRFTAVETLDPKSTEQCTIKTPTDVTYYLPFMEVTWRLWAMVLYYSVPKVIIGVVSAAIIFSSVLQPAVAIFTSGNSLIFASGVSFHERPTVYVIVVGSIWMAGAVGMVIMAVVSVKTTWYICSNNRMPDQNGNEDDTNMPS